MRIEIQSAAATASFTCRREFADLQIAADPTPSPQADLTTSYVDKGTAGNLRRLSASYRLCGPMEVAYRHSFHRQSQIHAGVSNAYCLVPPRQLSVYTTTALLYLFQRIILIAGVL